SLSVSSSCTPENHQKCDCTKKIEAIGNSNVPSTSSVAFTNGMTIGIRMSSDPGPQDVIVSLEEPGNPKPLLKIRLQEMPSNWAMLYSVQSDPIEGSWSGSHLECIPKDEWLQLTITKQSSGNVEWNLHGYHSLRQAIHFPDEGVTIKVDAGHPNLNSEVSFDC
ncbi:unnamed protein product, partial [Meganyctiphanes norvegica]